MTHCLAISSSDISLSHCIIGVENSTWIGFFFKHMMLNGATTCNENFWETFFFCYDKTNTTTTLQPSTKQYLQPKKKQNNVIMPLRVCYFFLMIRLCFGFSDHLIFCYTTNHVIQNGDVKKKMKRRTFSFLVLLLYKIRVKRRMGEQRESRDFISFHTFTSQLHKKKKDDKVSLKSFICFLSLLFKL